ncbi:MAG: MSHA biogenesis protein MshG [Legionellales bacterium]|nr:MAG: MSHA biogenesis protein MshG [Legionellales bacterium]
MELPVKLRQYINFGAPNLQDLVMLSRQLYSLLKAGVPIIRAINVVASSTKNQRLSAALVTILKDVEHGQALSVAIQKHVLIFPTLMPVLLAVGENTGKLDTAFQSLAAYFGRELETKRQITAATRYPIMVIMVIGVAISIINIFVIPAFAGFFKQLGADLPLPTRILIATSNFTINYWYFLVALFILLGFLGISFINTRNGRYIWDRFKLNIPIVGTIFKEALLARFARAFALSIRSGVPLLQAIKIVAGATDNAYVAAKILSMHTKIAAGESVTQAARNTKMFSKLVLQMLAVGEETGDIDHLLDEVAEFYEQEVDYNLKRLSSAIEPILISIVAGIVLVLALGVFLPMWNISQVSLH